MSMRPDNPTPQIERDMLRAIGHFIGEQLTKGLAPMRAQNAEFIRQIASLKNELMILKDEVERLKKKV